MVDVDYGNHSYSLSPNFLKQINLKAADHVLNKDEMVALGAIAKTDDEKAFMQDVLVDNLINDIPVWNESEPAEITFAPTAVTRSSNITGQFYQRVHRLSSDRILDKSDLAELGEGANADEKAMISKLRGMGRYSTGFGLSTDGTFEQLKTTVVGNYDVSPEFMKKLYELSQDISTKTLSKEDIDVLRKMASPDERQYLDTITSGSAYTNLPGLDSSGDPQLEPEVHMYYEEEDSIPGDSNSAKVSHISQKDRLDGVGGTETDNNRCHASAIVNAVILQGGEEAFIALAHSLGMDNVNSLTYENVHRVQDSLHTHSLPPDADPTQWLKVSYSNEKKVFYGTSASAFEIAGVKPQRVSGEADIKAFFAAHPDGVLFVSTKVTKGGLDFKTWNGKTELDENHRVIVKYEGGKFYMADTYDVHNGAGDRYREMTAAQVQAMMENSSHSDVAAVGLIK